MKNKTDDSNMPTGNLKRIKDLLPSPEDLVVNEETKKITISLKKSSVNFFKRQATRYHTKYQRMIRELLDKYAEQYSDSRN
jgi:predicted DNA binding CopG/RHH family protein